MLTERYCHLSACRFLLKSHRISLAQSRAIAQVKDTAGGHGLFVTAVEGGMPERAVHDHRSAITVSPSAHTLPAVTKPLTCRLIVAYVPFG
jgi:hypothetical protein